MADRAAAQGVSCEAPLLDATLAALEEEVVTKSRLLLAPRRRMRCIQCLKLLWCQCQARRRSPLRAPNQILEPCLKLPLRFPRGPPDPFAPPCIRHLERPLTAACLQARPALVRAPQRRALAKLESLRLMSA